MSDIMELLKAENEKRNAILDITKEKNIFIEAGAGAGKTKILIDRIVSQLTAKGKGRVDPEKLVAITFTDKATLEMKTRVQLELEKAKLLESFDKIHISTIHSLCKSMLEEMPVEAGVHSGFDVMEDETELINKVYFEYLNSTACDYLNKKTGIKDNLIYGKIIKLWREFCQRDNPAFDYVSDPLKIDKYLDDNKKELQQIADKVYDDLKNHINDVVVNYDPKAKVSAAGERYMDRVKEIRDGAQITKINDLPSTKSNKSKRDELFKGAVYTKSPNEASMLSLFGDIKKAMQNGINKYFYNMYALFFAGAYNEYKKIITTDSLTNDQLLIYTRDMLKNSPEARKHFQKKYSYFYVDEFQDTDPVQTEIVFYLCGLEKEAEKKAAYDDLELRDNCLCVVGDPKQSIYKFRGANVEIYSKLKAIFSKRNNCEVYNLDRNFRSNTEICQWVTDFFRDEENENKFGISSLEHNSSAIDFEGMFTNKTETNEKGILSGVYSFYKNHEQMDISEYKDVAEDNEAYNNTIRNNDADNMVALIKHIKSNYKIRKYNYDKNDSTKYTVKKKEIKYGDFLILTYNRSVGRLWNALKKENIPANLKGKIFIGQEIRNIYYIMRYIANNDKYSYSVVLKNIFGVNPKILRKYNAFDVMKSNIEDDPLYEKIKDINKKLGKYSSLMYKETPLVALEALVSDFELVMANIEYNDAELQTSYSHIQNLIEECKRNDVSSKDRLLDILKEKVKYVYNSKEDKMEPQSIDKELFIDDSSDAVSIMNLHQAKGLEGKIVILAEPFDEPLVDNSVWVNRYNNNEKCYENVYYGIMKKSRGILYDNSGNIDYVSESNAELVRKLYVAATRAEEALIIVHYDDINGSCKNSPWQHLLEEKIVASSRNFAQNITVSHSSQEDNKEEKSSIYDFSHIKVAEVSEESKEKPYSLIQPSQTKIIKGNATEEVLEEQKINDNSIDPEVQPLDEIKFEKEDEDTKEVDNSNESESNAKGSVYGTIVHRVFELVVNQARNGEAIALDDNILLAITEGMEQYKVTSKLFDAFGMDSEAGQELAQKSFKEQVKATNEFLSDTIKNIMNSFIESDVMDKIKNAQEVYTELSVEMSISDIKDSILQYVKTDDATDKMYVRGIMDLVLKEADGYTIIDYKTNYPKDNDTAATLEKHLIETYTSQLGLYEAMLKKMFSVDKAKTKYLYSTHLHKLIPIGDVSKEATTEAKTVESKEEKPKETKPEKVVETKAESNADNTDPTTDEYKSWILDALEKLGEAKTADLYDYIKKNHKDRISDEFLLKRRRCTDTRDESLFENRIRSVRSSLAKNGMLDGNKRDKVSYWFITEKGKEQLN